MLFVILAIVFSFVLSGCILGPQFPVTITGYDVTGTVYGVSSGATITVCDDLHECTTTWTGIYYLNVKPGVRTITYSCQGYTTVSTTVSVVGNTTINVTLRPLRERRSMR